MRSPDRAPGTGQPDRCGRSGWGARTVSDVIALNLILGPAPLQAPREDVTPAHRSTPDAQDGPHPDSRRRELDVQPLLAAGHEPFTEIMAALEDLGPGDVLALRARFNPRPLPARRHATARCRHAARKLGLRDVEVRCSRDAGAPSPPSPALESAEPPAVADDPSGYRTTVWRRLTQGRYGRALTGTSAPAATHERPQRIQARA